MNDDIPSRVLAIEARGRYEKRTRPAEQPRELSGCLYPLSKGDDPSGRFRARPQGRY